MNINKNSNTHFKNQFNEYNDNEDDDNNNNNNNIEFIQIRYTDVIGKFLVEIFPN